MNIERNLSDSDTIDEILLILERMSKTIVRLTEITCNQSKRIAALEASLKV